MDAISHGLWAMALTIKKKKWRWWTAGWGMFPDLGTFA